MKEEKELLTPELIKLVKDNLKVKVKYIPITNIADPKIKILVELADEEIFNTTILRGNEYESSNHTL